MNPQISGKKICEKKSGSFYCIKWFTLPPSGGKVTLPPEGRKVTLSPSNKGEQEIFSNVKGCNWIQNGIKYIFLFAPDFFGKNASDQ